MYCTCLLGSFHALPNTEIVPLAPCSTHTWPVTAKWLHTESRAVVHTSHTLWSHSAHWIMSEDCPKHWPQCGGEPTLWCTSTHWLPTLELCQTMGVIPDCEVIPQEGMVTHRPRIQAVTLMPACLPAPAAD